MPRAPHSSALLAGSPLANRSVFSISVSRMRSMPLSSIISTRLTRGTGARRAPLGCQMKASAASKSVPVSTAGASRSSAAATRASMSGSRLDEPLALVWLADVALDCPDGALERDFDFAMEVPSVGRSLSC